MSKYSVTIMEAHAIVKAIKIIENNSCLAFKEAERIVDRRLAFEYDEDEFDQSIDQLQLEFEEVECRINLELI